MERGGAKTERKQQQTRTTTAATVTTTTPYKPEHAAKGASLKATSDCV
jgi:hypothetical protein